MPDLLVRSFAPLLQAFQPCFTQPSFRSFWGLVCAWILCSGRRSLTRVIQSAQLSKFKHYCSFHRFFSHARWNLDELGHCVFDLLLPFCSPALLGAVDDTLARKSGRHIWGADMHHDPLRSTRARPFFSFGHNWVVFSLHVCFPFAPHKHWAIPILMRLYRKRKKHKLAPGRGGKWERKQTGQANPKEYCTRPQLALQMIQIVASWVPSRILYVTGDSEYGGRSISRHLPGNVHLLSRMTMKAALYELPPQHPRRRGRRRKKGKRLPSPQQMAENSKSPWIKTTVCLYLSVAVKNRSRLAADWSLSVLSLSLLERGVSWNGPQQSRARCCCAAKRTLDGEDRSKTSYKRERRVANWTAKVDQFLSASDTLPEFQVKNIHYISFVPSEALG